MSVSAYSMVAMVSRLGPLMRSGGSFLSLTYMASERVIPGYGGGMSSAKAALESDTRVLAFEAGRKYGLRVNTISAGPYASRAASAIGIIDRMVTYCSVNSPMTDPLTAEEGDAEKAQTLRAEETAAARALKELEGLDVDSPEFESGFARLTADVLAHAHEEEHDDSRWAALEALRDKL